MYMEGLVFAKCDEHCAKKGCKESFKKGETIDVVAGKVYCPPHARAKASEKMSHWEL